MSKRVHIILGADHAGCDAREGLRRLLFEQIDKPMRNGVTVVFVTDVGTHKPKVSVDYPVFAHNVARCVAAQEAKRESDETLGILVCGTGSGMAMAANRHKGVRAGVGYNEEVARLLREHNNCNVLCLGARQMQVNEMWFVVKAWLTALFDESGRHGQRVRMIEETELPAAE